MRRLLLALAACAGQGPDGDDSDDSDAVDTEPASAVDAGDDVVVEVGRPVTLTGVVPDGQATWDLGDGHRVEGATVTHTYTRPGNLTATLSVVLPGGLRRSDSVRVVAHLPPATPRPRASSSVVTDGERALVVEPDADHLVAIDLTTGAVSGAPTCERPRSLAVAEERVAVACEGDDRLALHDLSTLARLDTLELGAGARPFGVVRDEDGWAVSLQGLGAVARVGGEAGSARVALGPDARGLALDARGRAWSPRLRARQDGGDVFTEGARVALAPDPGPDSDTGNRGVATALRALAISPDGGTLYVGGTLSNVARGLATDGEALRFDVTVRATLRVVDVDARAERFEERKQLDNHGTIDALALSPLGNWLWVAHAGTHTIGRLDAYTLRAAGVILDAGAGIDGLAVTPDGSRLVVHAALDRQVRVYDVADPSSPAPALQLTASTVEEEPLPAEVLAGKRLFVDARDTRLTRDGYVSCDACHPDGRDDGLVWDFTQRGEGLRNTISLEGRAGTGMGPVHWSGNFDEIQDFEGDIRGQQGGAGLLAEADWVEAMHPLGPAKAGRSADLDALATYVASLATTPRSPHPAPEGGAARFEALGCATCHDPATAYTDSAPDVRHDVGTLTPASGQRLGAALDGLDTPTLLGAFATGPWLHDGSAPTLEAAIEAHTSGAGLSDEDLTLLAGFVRSL